MPEFLVRVHQPPAGVQTCRVQAADALGVAAALGVPPQRVLSVRPAAAAAGALRLRAARRPAFGLRLFCQELAVLLQAGIPLLEALTTLREKEADNGQAAQVLDGLRAGLSDGLALSAAMARAPQAFDPLVLAVVGASERSGQLAPALREHARYLAWAEGLRGKLLGAAIYPGLLMAASLAVMLFLLLFVLPRFAGVLEGVGREVPWASRMLIDLGLALSAHPALLATGLAAALVAAGVAWRTPALRAAAQAMLWRLPGLGPRLATLALAQCYRTLGLLLAAGVPMVPALALVQDVAGPRFRGALARLREDVSAGQRLSQALESHGLATPVARRMVRVGERSGTLAPMLESAAAFHDEELAQLSDFVTRAVNPVLMLVMGTLIGGIVVLMYLPIFTLVESVQ